MGTVAVEANTAAAETAVAVVVRVVVEWAVAE